MKTLTDKLKEARIKTDEAFLRSIQSHKLQNNEIDEAAKYSFIGGGKALRPFLVFTFGELLNLASESAEQIALAVEMVHTYSLIHDDLPAMDNDSLRRGKQTCHIRFSEATAILTGDALLTKAFEVLANPKTHPEASIRGELVSLLAQSAGINGMIGGQLIDINGETKQLTEEEIFLMQELKTGALLRFSCLAPAIAGKADVLLIKTIEAFAKNIGILFQITDDLLDAEGDEKIVGKTLQKDKKSNKSNFVTLYGVKKARLMAQKIYSETTALIDDTILKKSELLKQLTDFILTRNH